MGWAEGRPGHMRARPGFALGVAPQQSDAHVMWVGTDDSGLGPILAGTLLLVLLTHPDVGVIGGHRTHVGTLTAY